MWKKLRWFRALSPVHVVMPELQLGPCWALGAHSSGSLVTEALLASLKFECLCAFMRSGRISLTQEQQLPARRDKARPAKIYLSYSER